ncbi:unnamed protein product [Heligmosomoides polygyrus]|uniref:Exostosin domain-containing protein n=1 Tax=Heligmosomoides polygyrus TaxID=6339 RepID=A0A183G9B7_HELPZ|nr:unnamed protein product [Heligmosomoides polygyrus]
MLDHSYDILTPSCLGLAVSFYRSQCVHSALASVEDATKTLPAWPPRSGADPYHLPRMHHAAMRYADENPWNAESWKQLKPRRSLILLPEGFEDTRMCFEHKTMTAKVIRCPEDIEPEWFDEEFSAVLLISPSKFAETMRWRGAWFLLMQAVAKGAELVCLPGPQDDQEWGRSVDLLRDLMEETVSQRPPLARMLRCLPPLKSHGTMLDAPFKVLADKVNLVTGRHFTQSAAKRFWNATIKQHRALLSIPECRRITHDQGTKTMPQKIADPRQLAACSQDRDGTITGRIAKKPRSLSRPRQNKATHFRPDLLRRSLRGKGRGARF